MDREFGAMTLISRRALAAASGGLAILGVGSLSTSTEAKKKNKKRKKKIKPYVVEAVELTGENEVSDGDDRARGKAEFAVKARKGSTCEICSAFPFTTPLGSPISGAHIHQGPAGANGPIVIDFQGIEATCVIIDKGLAKAIKENPSAFYANVHTDNFPDGAVRGQLTTKE